VWARDNTRSAIFDPLRRKEVYATTGTRIRVRLFGGWDFTAQDLVSHDFADRGYGRGVPMGGDLGAAPEGGRPGFMIRALRDPDGANLDRIQVIKGWLDSDGNTHERVFDVAVSGGRAIVADGRAREPVGDTVDVESATYTNTIGDPFYYVRILEIPTPRWTTYDAVRLGVQLPSDVPPTVQDRVYTSPIWYSPGS
jgi:hypothetical protein